MNLQPLRAVANVLFQARGGAVPNASGTAEFAIDVSGVDAQAATGGVRVNFIPRDGGNRFSGTLVGSFAGESFAGDNYTGSDAQARGLLVPNKIKANGDFNPGFGGPIARDKLWYFVSGRYLFADNYVANMFFNENANRLDRFDYVRSANQAVLHQEQYIAQARVTWQVNEKNKIGATADFENFCACTTGISSTTSPEAGNDRRFPLQRFVTMDWNSPVSSRLLLEASGIHRVERWGGMHPQVGKLGNIAGVLVRSGEVKRNTKARLLRDGKVIAHVVSTPSAVKVDKSAKDVTVACQREDYEEGKIAMRSSHDAWGSAGNILAWGSSSPLPWASTPPRAQ